MTQPSESLRARLAREGQLPVAESLRIAAEVAGALAAGHARGIVRHDIRPENIHLSAAGASVAVLGSRGTDGPASHDRTYLSPEEANGRPPADGRSDIYSLGLVLYEMLAGEPPRDPIVPLRAGRRAVAEDVELIVAQALAPDPADRFESAADLAQALGSAAKVAGRSVYTTGERLAFRRRFTPRWAFFSTAVTALLGGSLWLRFTAVPPSDPPPAPAPLNSIAVLPLVNAGPDTANEYFSDGITRELISALGRVPGLRVVGPSSSFAFKRSEVDAQQAGRRLGVGAVVEGSVRQSGGRLRVTTHLVSVAQGFDLWSETYEGAATEVFAVQDEIARAIAGALRLRAPGGTGAPAASPRTRLDAYRAYLAGRSLAARPTEESVPAAIANFEIAIGLDSSFAPAWAALAGAHAQEIILGTRPTKEAAPLARAAAERALGLDSTLAPAHIALGLVFFLHDWNWAKAERELRRAIELNPNLPDPHHWYSHLLIALGRAEESLTASRRAIELSPVDPAMSAHLGWHYLFTGEYDLAGETLDRALAMDPRAPGPHFHLALLSAARGDFASAENHLGQVSAPAAGRPAVRAELGRIYALSGRTEEARRIRDELRETAMSGYVPSYHLAHLTLALGEAGRAVALLDEAAADRDESVVYLRVDPRLDRLRDDRRFARVVRRLGLP